MACRECSACTRSLVWRMTVALCWRWYGWMITMFTKRCPGCKHGLQRHAKRRDGSFMD